MTNRIGFQAAALILLVALSITAFNVPPVHATPPTDIALDYNQSTQKLFVNATHEVPNPKNHYIELIEVFKNGNFQVNRTYQEQEFNYGLYDNFTIVASPGDNITVTVTCSRGDSLTNWIVVSTTTTGSTSTTSSSTTTTTTTTTTTATTGTQTNTTLEPLNPTAVFVVGIASVVIIVILLALYQSGYGEKLRPLVGRMKTGLLELGAKISSFFGSIRQRLTRT